VLFTVASAHLLAMEAHEGQVDGQGGDYYLHVLVPLAEAARPYGALAEMAAVLHRVIEDTRNHPDVNRRYDLDRLRALQVPDGDWLRWVSSLRSRRLTGRHLMRPEGVFGCLPARNPPRSAAPSGTCKNRGRPRMSSGAVGRERSTCQREHLARPPGQ
jgi:hypothetical protein